MKLAQYRSEDYDRLCEVAARVPAAAALAHRPFVDHFYATSDASRLHLLNLPDAAIAGTLGLEGLRFEHDGRELLIGSPTNYYSLHPGAGGYLFLHWLKTYKVGMVFGGSADTHRILQQQSWTYYPGVKVYLLNRAYPPQPGEPRWKTAAKWLREKLRPTLRHDAARMRRAAPAALTVREEHVYTDDLLPSRTPFAFRFAPTAAYLSWRYATQLSFVRYRLFRILSDGCTAGYVILNDQPDRLLVAHCDGDDPVTLAYGIALSVAAASCHDRRPREVLLTSAHAAMQPIFERFGFRPSRQERPFVLGSLRHRNLLPPTDTSNWLINYDIADNGLRPPFLSA
jgi:hypothetical protein